MMIAVNDEPEALLVLPPLSEDIIDKIILCRCEKEAALTVGQAFHLNKFQGWAIDRLAAGKTGAEAAPAS